MADLMELNDRIDKSGLKKGHISAEMGITRAGLRNKLQGKSPMTTDDAAKLTYLLHLTPKESADIFLSRK